MSISEEEIISAIDALYREEQNKNVQSIIKAIKAKRRLRRAYITYNQYIAEMIDNSISYTDYLAENLNTKIAYTEYLAERIK